MANSLSFEALRGADDSRLSGQNNKKCLCRLAMVCNRGPESLYILALKQDLYMTT